MNRMLQLPQKIKSLLLLFFRKEDSSFSKESRNELSLSFHPHLCHHRQNSLARLGAGQGARRAKHALA
jgi:hypothetical protein